MCALAVAIIIADNYMDDIVSGAISVVERRKLIKQMLNILDAGGFRVHKISACNAAMVYEILPDQV